MIKVPQVAQREMEPQTMEDVVKDILYTEECVSQEYIIKVLKKKLPDRIVNNITVGTIIGRLRDKGNIIVRNTYYKIL